MAPHTRTRTGCWTCREAGYKCDEKKPFCGRCTRLKLVCEGYGIRIQWKTPRTSSEPRETSRRGKKRAISETKTASSPMSTSSIVSAPANLENPRRSPQYGQELDLPLVPLSSLAPDLPANDQRLLHYWLSYLSSLISITPRSNMGSPFQRHLTAMACVPGPLRSTVLSMSATHLSLMSQDSCQRFQVYRHQCDAVMLLQQLIQDPTKNTSEFALATVLMMQISARLFGEEDPEPQVANHLIGAKAMIMRRGSQVSWSDASVARFLCSLFAYHDILSSVSRGGRPLAEHDHEFVGVEDDASTESIAKVLHVVARISKLQCTTRSGANESVIFHAIAADIKSSLINLAPTPPPLQDDTETLEHMHIRLTSEAYRHAAFIYLYRVWLGIGAPNPMTLHHVQQCLACLEEIDVSSPLVSSHIWPLWTAGCEAVSPNQREFVRQRFHDMFWTRMFPSLKRTGRDIEEVWTAKDLEQMKGGEDSMTKVDCIQVMKRRGREVDFA